MTLPPRPAKHPVPAKPKPAPGPNTQAFTRARQALSDAQHAGDPTYAAMILHETARQITQHVAFWTTPGPPLGRRNPRFPRTHTAPRKAA